MDTTPTPAHDNRLAHETSPYLLQHRHNPVDWWPWGPEALAEAERTGKPILLSVGYAACHWCHVMAHESFEDPATAAVMNELFVPIKVDREERPDIDQIYMAALHHLGDQGGWPLTMFLTPSGEPVWGGTYFPRVSRFGKPAFVDVLREVSRLFREEPEKIEQNRRALMGRLAHRAQAAGRPVIGLAELDRMAAQIAGAIDLVNGGLRGAPKFPQPTMLETIWRAGEREDARTGFAHPTNLFYDLVALTLERMCEGGIFDHLGGGFARYSVDDRWLVPHFEKMLYDNAQLLELLALAHARTGHELFRQRAEETVGWLLREMTTPEGAFCASLDADSEGEEGKFYVWTLEEIVGVLGPEDAARFAAHYDVEPAGNFEGKTILDRLPGLDQAAQARTGLPFALHKYADARIEADLAAMRQRLFDARSTRVRPGTDDKILADWNGLTIAALANAGTLLDVPASIDLARRAFAFVATEMTRHGRLGHSWRDGRLLFPGLASDYAAMIRAALALHEATGEKEFLDRAVAWQEAFDHHHQDVETGTYYLSADDAEGLVVRPSATTDDAIPNPNGLAAQNLVRLAVLTGDDRWRERADALLEGLLPRAADNLFGHLSVMNALDLRLRGLEIAIVGEGPHIAALTGAAQHIPFGSRILFRAPSPEALPENHPARAQAAAAPEGAAFVCAGERCSLPVTTPEGLREAILSLVTPPAQPET
ncbi:Thymidylate kinase [Rhodovulum sp. PH10]|uniref:thioredoxin domain-containing protein n=1 Tax=Rhodovulum sp. PH10 TaxID=1187851 RepID=UPI00027C248F|nr:thioredoxin domain-containing protein [Rhodovulum sp. PH10]EJW13069.1 Thymidylate kinase [Rhodovulum sp. PH10]